MLTRNRARRGVTLAELLVVMTILAIVGTVLVRVIVRQQRFYAGAAELMTSRGNLRELSAVLPSDLRSLSSVGGDIYAMTDSSIDFRRVVGSSVACQIPTPTGLIIMLPPASLGSRSAVTSWLSMPVVNDSVLVYDEGATSAVSDDSWRPYKITAITSSGGSCPTTTGFTATNAEAIGAYKLTLSGALVASVVQGAPIRFFRRAHYGFYRNAAGESYLGYFECPGGTCAAMQPIAGPFMDYVAGGGGLTFSFADSTGAATADRALVARVDVVARSRTRAPVTLTGNNRAYVTDSLAFTAALRNR